MRRRSSDSFQLVWVRSRDRYDVEQRGKWDESQQGRLRQLRDADDRVPVQRPVAQDDRQVARAGDAVDHQRAPRLQQRFIYLNIYIDKVSFNQLEAVFQYSPEDK